MNTRKQYLNHECTHRQYYAQFVDATVKARVARIISIPRILASKDPDFNDIPLKHWDLIHPHTLNMLKDYGDIPTLAGAVCIAKEAAMQIKEEKCSKTIEAAGGLQQVMAFMPPKEELQEMIKTDEFLDQIDWHRIILWLQWIDKVPVKDKEECLRLTAIKIAKGEL